MPPPISSPVNSSHANSPLPSPTTNNASSSFNIKTAKEKHSNQQEDHLPREDSFSYFKSPYLAALEPSSGQETPYSFHAFGQSFRLQLVPSLADGEHLASPSSQNNSLDSEAKESAGNQLKVIPDLLVLRPSATWAPSLFKCFFTGYLLPSEVADDNITDNSSLQEEIFSIPSVQESPLSAVNDINTTFSTPDGDSDVFFEGYEPTFSEASINLCGPSEFGLVSPQVCHQSLAAIFPQKIFGPF